MDSGRVLSTGTRLRVGVVVFVLLVNAVHGSSLDVLPWALLVLAADIMTGAALTFVPLQLHDRRVLGLTLTLAGAAVAGFSLTAGAGALPLVIIPVFRAAEEWGRRVVAAATLTFLVPAVLAWTVPATTTTDLEPASLALWGALTVSLGALVAWTAYLAPHQSKDDALAAEATWLLTRLEGLAAEMRAGFDPATSAEHVLDALPSAGIRSRSGVLIGSPTDRPVPLALRGSLRVPWPDPRDDHGVIGEAWHHGRPGVTFVDDGRIRLAIPLRDARDRQYGILVSDGMGGDAVPAEDLLAATSAVARQHQGLVAVALAFGGLRERAGIEERERLARQIHDGIAQELVAVGFRMDRLRRLPDAELRQEVASLRAEVTRILGDVRSHIGDLRLTVRPEGGLGAAITSQLQVFGAATGAVVNLRLSESSFRLPAHVETGLYRIVLDFIADARHSATMQDLEVEVSLRTQAPDAEMVLRQSGPTRLTESDLSPHLSASLGAVVMVTGSSSGTQISVHLTAVPEASAVLDERLPQPS
jgi:signal transduction histidine kinase